MNDAVAPLSSSSSRVRYWANIVVNTILFKVAWWVCVLGGAWGYPWAGVVMTLPALVVHVALVGAWRSELLIVGVAGLYGYLADSALVWSDIMVFPPRAQLLGPSPLWMVMLWLGFGATVRTALRFLFARPWLAIGFGVVIGPLSYRGGEALDAVWIDKSTSTTLLLAALWGGAMALLCVLLRLTDRWPDPVTRNDL